MHWIFGLKPRKRLRYIRDRERKDLCASGATTYRGCNRQMPSLARTAIRAASVCLKGNYANFRGSAALRSQRLKPEQDALYPQGPAFFSLLQSCESKILCESTSVVSRTARRAEVCRQDRARVP
jgi:hypothetical protein